MTIQKEDFIKQLLMLGCDAHLISNKKIASSLHISPASVTEMLSKLEKEQIVEYVPYKGSRLSKKGNEIAISLLRSHRLWEVFLMKYLEYGWEEIHTIAERLEHATDAVLAARLEHYLGYPQYCPHGDSIPKEGEHNACVASYSPLTTMDSGSTVIIRRVTQETELLAYLKEKCLNLGTQLRLIDKDSYEGSFTIEVDNQMHTVSYKAAGKVFVERVM